MKCRNCGHEINIGMVNGTVAYHHAFSGYDSEIGAFCTVTTTETDTSHAPYEVSSTISFCMCRRPEPEEESSEVIE